MLITAPTRFATRVAAAALTLLALLPAVAPAQDEVFRDPGSPSGKEYAIPLEEARREAGGGAPNGDPSATAAFGVGIEKDRQVADEGSGGSGAGNQADAGERDGHSPAAGGESTAGSGEAGVAGSSARFEVVRAEAASPFGWSAGLAGTVLLAGLVAGALVRRRTRGTD